MWYGKRRILVSAPTHDRTVSMEEPPSQPASTTIHLGERIVAEIDGLGMLELVGGAPGLAPQPLLRQRLDRHLHNTSMSRFLMQAENRS